VRLSCEIAGKGPMFGRRGGSCPAGTKLGLRKTTTRRGSEKVSGEDGGRRGVPTSRRLYLGLREKKTPDARGLNLSYL